MSVKTSHVASEIVGIALDIFGTVVDWRGSIIREGRRLSTRIDWGAFAGDWLVGYRSRVEAVRTGQRPWANLDVLLVEAFAELSAKFDLSGLDVQKVARFGGVWHRLRPWADVAGGLARLRTRFRLGTLSNANVLLLVDLARHSALPWDCVICAESAGKYKPEPRPYELAAAYLGPQPGRVLYVAAHKWDLLAAKALGMRTAYLPRPEEMGDPAHPPEDPAPDPAFDINAPDFEDLADQLGT